MTYFLRKLSITFLAFLLATLTGSASEVTAEALSPAYPPTMASGTIPLVVINTDDNLSIEDKVNYLPGSLYISVPDGGKWEACGTAEKPVRLSIRGRGNWSWWVSPKKAYKIKFNAKTSVLGMPKHKHFALLCYDPFYPTLWLAPAFGLELGRLAEFPWTPSIEPVEVVLNGEYRGIYLLVESLKTGKDRLDITTQPEENTQEELLPYGWLVELDNQNDEFQISIPSQNQAGFMRVTHKEPELLSSAQRKWLTDEFTHLTELIEYPEMFPDDKWTDHFDLESLAKYVIVREVLHDIDGYSGSQYFYKDINSEKWFAGPLWDMELWPHDKTEWISEKGHWSLLNWVPFMMKSYEFRAAFKEEWDKFYPEKFNKIHDYIDSFAGVYQAADLANTKRWPSEKATLDAKIDSAKLRLNNNAMWVDQHTPWMIINEAVNPVADYAAPAIRLHGKTLVVKSSTTVECVNVYDISGTKVFTVTPASEILSTDLSHLNHGIYIVEAKNANSQERSRTKIIL